MSDVIDFLIKKKLINNLSIQTIHHLIANVQGHLKYVVDTLRSKGIKSDLLFQV